MKQTAIAIDEVINTLVYAKADRGFGKADETLSARAWRLRRESKNWAKFQMVVDDIFLVFRVKDHCFKAWISEQERRHLPSTGYRK